MQYPGEAAFPTAADWAQSRADDAEKKSTDVEAQLRRLLHALVAKGVLSESERLQISVGDQR